MLKLGRSVAAVAALAATLGSTALSAPEASAAGRPDLRVVKVARVAGSADPGATFVVAVTVRNGGAAGARASTVRLTLSRDVRPGKGDLVAGSVPVAALAKGRSATVKARVKVPAKARGSYYVIACADSARRVKESKESNNCRPSGRTVEVAGDVEGDLSGTVGLVDTGDRTDGDTAVAWDRRSEVRLDLSVSGPHDDPTFADTDSSYGYQGKEVRTTGGSCPRRVQRDEAGAGGFVYTGDPLTDDIRGSIARVDYSEIRVGLSLHYDQTTVDQSCDSSRTSSGKGLDTVSVRFRQVSHTATSITYEPVAWEAEYGTSSHWQRIDGTVTLELR